MKKPKTIETKVVIDQLEKGLKALRSSRRKRMTCGQFFQILCDAINP